MKASPSIQSTIDESKESIGVSQLISGLTSFFQVRTSLMKLWVRSVLIGMLTFIWRWHRYEQISSAVKRNETQCSSRTVSGRDACYLSNQYVSIEHICTHTHTSITKVNRHVACWYRQRHFSRRHEIDCLLLLIQSYVSICDYKYMEAISTLHHMHGVLKEWHDNIENQQNANLRFTLTGTSALNFFKSPTKPALYTFYSKFHELLVAKVRPRALSR